MTCNICEVGIDRRPKWEETQRDDSTSLQFPPSLQQPQAASNESVSCQHNMRPAQQASRKLLAKSYRLTCQHCLVTSVGTSSAWSKRMSTPAGGPSRYKWARVGTSFKVNVP
jgi:hypothetical protein